MLAVNYQGLIPVLINALKEQDAKRKEQDDLLKERDDKLKERDGKIARLEVLIKKLIANK